MHKHIKGWLYRKKTTLTYLFLLKRIVILIFNKRARGSDWGWREGEWFPPFYESLTMIYVLFYQSRMRARNCLTFWTPFLFLACMHEYFCAWHYLMLRIKSCSSREKAWHYGSLVQPLSSGEGTWWTNVSILPFRFSVSPCSPKPACSKYADLGIIGLLLAADSEFHFSSAKVAKYQVSRRHASVDLKTSQTTFL